MCDESISWDYLPADILIDILSHLTLAERCQASSVCKRWRDAFWAPKLWRKVVLDLKNRRDGDRANLLRRVVPFTRSLTVVWPHMGIKKRESDIDVQHRKTLVLLMESLRENTVLEHLDLRFENAFSVDSKFVQPVMESLSIVLTQAPHLQYLCLGAHPLITPPNLSSLLAHHQKNLDIVDLHIGTVQLMHSMKYRTSIKLEPSAVRLLTNVTYLTLDWTTVTAEFLDTLNDIERPPGSVIKKLSLFLHSHQCYGDHPTVEAWNIFNRRNPGVKVTVCTAGPLCRDHSLYTAICPANERRRCIVTSYLIGWAHIQNDRKMSYYMWHNVVYRCLSLVWYSLAKFHNSGLILSLHPANERRRYFVMTSLIGWAQAKNMALGDLGQHWFR